MRRTLSIVVIGLLACLAGAAMASTTGSGIARIDIWQPAAAAPTAAQGPATLHPTSRRDRLEVAVGGAGWWRIDPAPSSQERLLLVFHPYSARVTVLMPPGYQPQVQSLFDANLDPRYSRRTLVFPVPEPGPIFIHVEQARYPLQVALRGSVAHAVSDHSHLQVVYGTTGVLVGVCLAALVFWLVLRDRVYLLYAGCMAMQLLYVLCAYGEAYTLPGLRWLAGFGAPGIWGVATLSTIVSVCFLLDFGELRARVPRLSRWLTWVGAWLPALALLLLVSPWPQDKGWFPGVGNLLLLVANVLAIVCLVLAWRRGGRHAGMILLAWIPLVVISTARAWQLGTGAALAPWLEYGLPLVLAYAAVVLMLGMADRMRAFRRERDHAQLAAERDALTGVLNRGGLERRLGWALSSHPDPQPALSLLFLDIDHFKRINDTHGHAVGDACLVALVRVIRSQLQYGDQVGRLGGEEFLLVLAGADPAHAGVVAERIRHSVEDRCRHVNGVRVEMTVSIGVAGRRSNDMVNDLVARADTAMYAAKRAGRNRVVGAPSVDDPGQRPDPATVSTRDRPGQ